MNNNKTVIGIFHLRAISLPAPQGSVSMPSFLEAHEDFVRAMEAVAAAERRLEQLEMTVESAKEE
jgi:hypothetical protein